MPGSSWRRFPAGGRRKKSGPGSRSRTELVWGVHSVLEGLQTRPEAVLEIVVAEGYAGRRLEQILATAREKSIPVRQVPGKIKTNAARQGEPSGFEPSQGVGARVKLPVSTLEDLLARLEHGPGPPLVLALDSIQDPHNLGAIIRSAVAAGVTGIILPRDRSASITGTVIRISAGAVYHLDICLVTNLVNSLKMLKDHGIWIFGAGKDAAQSIYEVDLTVPACLVIGGEEKGLRPLVAGQCDFHVTIPMQSPLDSLNASVAAGIILFEAVRQRRSPKA